jgi:hypothetical protein
VVPRTDEFDTLNYWDYFLEDFHECASEHTQASFGILKECGMFAVTFCS